MDALTALRTALRTAPTAAAIFALACKSEPAPEPTSTPEPAPVTQTDKGASVETAKAPATPAPAETAPASSAGSSSASSSSAASSSAPEPPAAPSGMKPVAKVAVSDGDPAKGVFTLDDATKGLAGKGKLTATIQTDKGALKCELWPDKAPITVANFVGLARGVRPWKTPEGEWVKKPLYDGTTFHRIIKGFMIQGGDPKGNGSGDPGFVIPDEIWAGAHHDQIGLICMANRGPNTNGSQFFIMDGVAAHLDGGYTIFGKCTPDTVIEAIANTQGAPAPKMTKVTVARAKS